MKLNKQNEKDLMHVYNTWWHSYLNGDVKTYDSFLSDDYRFIGSTNNEDYLNRKDTTKFFEDTAEQMSGKAELRNLKRTLDVINKDLVLITDLADAYVLSDSEWIYYSRFRFTSLMKKTKEGWRFTYQHFSAPDNKAQDGETLGTEQISKENQELRDAIKRRTIELEHRNRELEVETALEKVRAVALGMKEPKDMLEVCKTISLQLESLGVKEIRNVQTAIFYVSRSSYMNYEYYSKHKKTFITDTCYTDHEIANAFANKMLKGKGEVSITNIKGKKVKEWIAYQKTTNVFIDKFLENTDSLNYYWHSLGPVALGISTYSSLSKDDLSTFNRFLKVFELAYTRYLDIQKAEAQAWEVQIELALERVRSRTMAMQHSNELQEAAMLMFQQIETLGVPVFGCGFNIWDDNRKAATAWMAGKDRIQPSFKTSSSEDVFLKIHAAAKKGESLFVEEQTGAELKTHYKYMASIPVFKGIIDEMEKNGLSLPKFQIMHCAFFSQGYLMFISFEPAPDAHDIFKRFAKVFEQTYTRFLDLQKAEAQAKEVQIELALERVRSRSMAMQTSHELMEAGALLYKELNKLGIENLSTGYMLFDDEARIGYSYGVNPADGSIRHKPVEMPHDETPVMKSIVKSWKKQDRMLLLELSPKETIKHQTFIAERSTNFPLTAEQLIAISPKKLKIHTFNFKQGYLLIIGGTLLTVVQQEIVVRFAKVFQQTYTRFLDLQKAEAQAKEAQIEAALERVRSRSMGMQKSEELEEVIQLVNDQFVHLKINTEHTGFVMDYMARDDYDIWIADKLEVPSHLTIPYFDCVYYNRFNEAKKKGENFFATNLTFKEKNKFYKKLIEYIPDLPEETKEFLFSVPGLAASTALLDNVCLYIENFEGIPYTAEENSILMRFGKVFQQTYTRFLDLQKAEAQAKESQIEVALERVRSRTMAMHKSDELREAGGVLYQELTKLNITSLTIGYVLMDETEKIGWNYTANPADGTIWEFAVGIPHDETDIMRMVTRSWKKQEPFSVIKMDAEQTIVHQTFIAERGINFPYTAKELISFSPEKIILYNFNFKQGYLLIVGDNELLPEQVEMMVRFTNVFQQTYTRFLDLQKAEAQAREAQIEAALERVRSRSMAMHNSEELADLSLELVKQVHALGVSTWFCAFNIYDADGSGSLEWGSNGENTFPRYRTPREGVFLRYYKAGQKGETLLINEIGENECPDHYEWLCTLPGVGEQLLKIKNAGIPFPKSQIDHAAYFKYGYILFITFEPVPEAHDIFKRFAKVFEQTYTRFLDLQKAEAQTREAQINLAVERVRAKALAMHKSEEIMEVVAKLKDEVMNLNIPDVIAATIFLKEDDDKVRMWDLSTLEKNNDGYQIPFDITFKLKKRDPNLYVKRVWENPENYFLELQEEKDFKRIIEFLRENNKIEIANEVEEFIGTTQLKRLHHAVKKLNNGKLVIDLLNPPPAEMETILTKMGAAFDLAYKRFEDLQKSEDQTKEAKIEAALERVRAKAMAMHSSTDIPGATVVVFNELIKLGINIERCGIVVFQDSAIMEIWSTPLTPENNEAIEVIAGHLNTKIHPLLDGIYKSWLDKKTYYSYELKGKEVEKYYTILENEPGYHFPKITKYPKLQIVNLFYFKEGGLFIYQKEKISEETKKILVRFTNVFSLTYRRYLDIIHAEAQAREAQIEVALERVRSRSMAMHKSEELLDVINVVSEQLQQLDFKFIHVSFANNDSSKDYKFWTASKGMPKPMRFNTPYSDIAMFNNLREAQEKSVSFFTDILTKEEHNQWHQHLLNHGGSDVFSKEENEFIMSRGMARSIAINPNIILILANYASIPFSEDENKIIERFGQVFEQSYTRFLDLQKAEAQARESQIEAALEKVRSRSLAMHKPDELQEVVAVVAEKLQELGVIFDAGGVILCTYFPDNKDVVHWIAVDDFSSSGRYLVPYFDNPIFNDAWDSKIRGDVYFSKEFTVEAKNHFFEYAFEHSDYKHFPEDYKQHVLKAEKHALSAAWSKNSAIIIPTLTGVMPSESDAEILKRFAKVFEQAYIRFMDLQKAETQARESQIQLALERVRARTLAMQNSEELAETSVVVFQQLLELGISPNRLFIGLIDSDEKHIDAWATNEDGTKLANHFILEASKNRSIFKMIQGWKEDKKSIVIDMEGKELQSYFYYLNQELKIPFQHGLEQKRRVQTIAYFSGGLIGMAASEEQPNESIDLLERFAAVFNLTYTRFKDLKIAEANATKAEEDLVKLQTEKKRAEEALTELKTTQKQLIQSEKMASLGELTAGIAHEIQNPLNFVNNFSEVSNELLDEMWEEISNGNFDDVKEILNDVKLNLQKINHHGKRADDIVKGMLQHSRSSSAVKEPTDINNLCDEYLRLSYHGLRAKDKSFNATLKTDFDPKLEKINIIPQDMGRVILNLLNNAFYAVTERNRSQNTSKIDDTRKYEPTVSISTKTKGKHVEIRITDNGHGIPQHVVDKIFQPFFTTKPTGKGTGLGLSLSYDIVITHNGELKVETNEGEGTTFSIYLPTNKNL